MARMQIMLWSSLVVLPVELIGKTGFRLARKLPSVLSLDLEWAGEVVVVVWFGYLQEW